jgi:23S rRNA (adenine2503-C2)-methyltransferase
MGMGEPLFNYDEVTKAIRMMVDPDGISIGKRRITVSTSGVVPQIGPLGEMLDVNLAVSLHAVTDELRDKIVPLNRKYPIKELMEACKNYPGVSNSRRITFEYVMLKGVNDRAEDAMKLIKLLRDVPSKVNLIPFNPWPGAPFECSDADQIERFGIMLNEAGYVSPIRKTRGQDIMAACGQLKSASMRLSAAEREAMLATQHEKDVAQGLA